MKTKTKLNVGCYGDYRKDWVNLDNNPKCKLDVLHDINNTPFPFKDNTFNEICIIGTLEHSHEPLRVIKEFWRICKKDALIYIEVPHWSSPYAYGDLTHFHYFTARSFSTFQEAPEYFDGEESFNVKVRYMAISWRATPFKRFIGSILNKIINFNISFTENIISKWIPIYGIVFELRVIK